MLCRVPDTEADLEGVVTRDLGRDNCENLDLALWNGMKSLLDWAQEEAVTWELQFGVELTVRGLQVQQGGEELGDSLVFKSKEKER